MEVYFVFVAIILILAVVDLTVGVANDAVNFLNGAIGSNAAKLKTILIFASVGIMVGVTFSGGMMEVARKGVFNPSFFNLEEVLIIFVALMIQDVILLDIFNAYGLPTSTTVTLIFGLLGGSLGVGLLKLYSSGQSITGVFQFVNSDNVLIFVSAILASIVFAFSAGALIQFLTRLIFSFNYKPNFRKFGSIWSGLALTSLSYFLIIKGIKGATFLTEHHVLWIDSHAQLILFVLFSFWTLFTQLLLWFTKVEVLKIIVLFGTFSLAMSFAANDLVNFMGAPLVSLFAYQHVANNPETVNESMVFLTGKIHIETWIMLICGGIMVATLFLSKKAKTVIETSIGLTKQNEGLERFESNMLARIIVRMSLNTFKVVKQITPAPILNFIKSRFDLKEYKPEENENGSKQAFDLIRAAVILMVSAALISLGTSYKLPLSTTYVTFIVAMAAALPDKAWGRDTAVYRVAGVINVIGGWFLTAFSASLFAFIVATIISFGGIYALLLLFALTIFIMYKNSVKHKKRETKRIESERKYIETKVEQNTKLNLISEDIIYYIGEVKDIFNKNYLYLKEENVVELKKNKKRAKKTNELANSVMSKILTFMKQEVDGDPELQFNLSRISIVLQEIYDRLSQITNQCYNYVDNGHVAFVEVQFEEYNQVILQFDLVLSSAVKFISTPETKEFEDLEQRYSETMTMLNKFNKNQIRRVKKTSSNVRRSMLYLSLLNDAERIIESSFKLCQSVYTIEFEIETEQRNK